MITTLIDIFNIQFASKEQTLSYQSSSFHKFWLTKTNFKKWLNVCLRIISGNQNNILVSIIIKAWQQYLPQCCPLVEGAGKTWTKTLSVEIQTLMKE
jgi:hypothetical protein